VKGPGVPDKVDLVISVDDEHMSRFSEVVKRCEAVGMDVDQQMEEIGVVTGSIEPEKVNPLSDVEGVSHVEQSRTFQIAPPDSDVQ
jgi:hypothetical protein